MTRSCVLPRKPLTVGAFYMKTRGMRINTEDPAVCILDYLALFGNKCFPPHITVTAVC